MAKKTIPLNPYKELDTEFQEINTRYLTVKGELSEWRDRFNKIFLPDQTEFDALKDKAKDMQWRKAPQTQIDTVYLNMAMIYKKWLPIESKLFEMNPSYIELFKGLKAILECVEKSKKPTKTKKEKGI